MHVQLTLQHQSLQLIRTLKSTQAAGQGLNPLNKWCSKNKMHNQHFQLKYVSLIVLSPPPSPYPALPTPNPPVRFIAHLTARRSHVIKEEHEAVLFSHFIYRKNTLDTYKLYRNCSKRVNVKTLRTKKRKKKKKKNANRVETNQECIKCLHLFQKVCK